MQKNDINHLNFISTRIYILYIMLFIYYIVYNNITILVYLNIIIKYKKHDRYFLQRRKEVEVVIIL